jgi:hypothetical protein
VTVAALTALGLAGLPRLQTESSPENLIISFGDYEARVRAFRDRFGDTDNVMMLLLEADDATSLEALRYQHELARHFGEEPLVLRVDGLTVTPLPRGPGDEAAETGASLDDLDALEAEQPPADPEVEAALQTLIASEPERFPSGMYDVAERVTDADREPIVSATRSRRDTSRSSATRSPSHARGRPARERQTARSPPWSCACARRSARATSVSRSWIASTRGSTRTRPPAGMRVHRAGLPHLRTAIVRHMAAISRSSSRRPCSSASSSSSSRSAGPRRPSSRCSRSASRSCGPWAAWPGSVSR